MAEEEKLLRRLQREGTVSRWEPYRYEAPPAYRGKNPPVVVGMGPAGLFAAYILALSGARPVLLERGLDVDSRARMVEVFQSGGELDEQTNVQFGEGGAGAFSDGKLNTGTKDPRIRKVLETLAEFGAPEVCFHIEYDEEFVDAVSARAAERSFPAGTLGERKRELDHGTMVPLWFILKKYKDFKLVRTGLSGLDLTKHYEFGKMLAQTADALGRRVVYVASGDLSHKLKDDGPYGFSPEGPEYDRRIMDVCGRGAFPELFDFSEEFCDKAAECGHRSFIIMAGALDGTPVKATAYSHEDVTGVGYGLCSFFPAGMNGASR